MEIPIDKDHPIVRFYIVRYKQGQTRIPEKWREATLQALIDEGYIID